MADSDFVGSDDDDNVDHIDPDAVAIVQQSREAQAAAVLASKKEILQRRREAYVRVMAGKATGADIQIVLTDLKTFCRGDTTAFHENERTHVLLTGRQEVYLRIKDHMTDDLDTLVEKYL